MCREIYLLILVYGIALVWGQKVAPAPPPAPAPIPNRPSSLSQRIGNFSLEFLYRVSQAHGDTENLIISPITVWTVLAVISEGATGNTYEEIRKTARIPKFVEQLHINYQENLKWLTVNSPTVQLEQVNTLFADKNNSLERDYKDLISRVYRTQMIPVDFKDSTTTANLINRYVQEVTRGRIQSLVDESTIADSKMLLASALYFKGQWTAPFNSTSTIPKPFYDSNDKIIGQVNMMYNRYTYPFANIKQLQARVIELPYGNEGRLSMLIMLPHPNVTLENMFLNFQLSSLSFKKVFHELRLAKEEYAEDEVDCFIPRFKIESHLTLDTALKRMGIYDMFDSEHAWLVTFILLI